MKPNREVGIAGYGAYLPRYRIRAEEIARVWGTDGANGDLPIEEKTVAGLDEDTLTMALEAARHALVRAQIEPNQLRAVWVGSESHPYAVKPTATVVAQALGAVPLTQAADWQFACKAGTEALQAGFALVGSGTGDYALAIGADTAQGRPSDELEYTASAGGAAFVVGPAEQSLAVLEGSLSFVTDTPDFFRRPGGEYPQHGMRFTGEPAYFHHTLGAARALLEELGAQPSDYHLAIFHQPNTKFPLRAAQMLGFSEEQVRAGLIVAEVGNTYAGSSLLGLAAALDGVPANKRIFLVSFGSGAGSDAFSLRTTSLLASRRDLAPRLEDFVRRKTYIDYATYARFRKKLKV